MGILESLGGGRRTPRDESITDPFNLADAIGEGVIRQHGHERHFLTESEIGILKDYPEALRAAQEKGMISDEERPETLH